MAQRLEGQYKLEKVYRNFITESVSEVTNQNFAYIHQNVVHHNELMQNNMIYGVLLEKII